MEAEEGSSNKRPVVSGASADDDDVESKRLRSNGAGAEDVDEDEANECITLTDENESDERLDSDLENDSMTSPPLTPELRPAPQNSDSDSDEDEGDESFMELIKKQNCAPAPGELFGPRYEVTEGSFIIYRVQAQAGGFHDLHNR
jgi:hypothetical protein